MSLLDEYKERESNRNSEQEYWRSVEQLADTPEYEEMLIREFPEGADSPPANFSRRRFLQLMGASISLAGFSGCRWPKEEIRPYAYRPEGLVPGVPRYFATTFDINGHVNGVVATSYDGRPIKIEGNEVHPMGMGSTDSWAQASVLQVYDPDRSRKLAHRAGSQIVHPSWAQFQKSIQADLASLWQDGGNGFVVLSERSSSPSLADLRTRLLSAYPQARWVEYEPISWDAMREGAQTAFGEPYRVHGDFTKAAVVAALDDDLFGHHPTSLKNARDFMKNRDGAGRNMNRLYAIEPVHSITGSVADHRLPLRASEIEAFAHALAAELAKKGVPIASAVKAKLKTGDSHVPHDYVAALAADLAENRGRSIVTAGYRQPASVHALVNAINAALGNIGQTVLLTADVEGERATHDRAIADLAADMNAGRVKVLAMLGGNPVYDAPADLGFGDALAKVRTSVHLSMYEDETSRRSTWHLPQAHYLETWNDARAWDGTIGTVQPLIDPLHDGKSNLEVVAMLLGEQPFSGYEIVRRTFRSVAGPVLDFEKSWRRALHEGIVENTALPTATAALNAAAVAGVLHAGSHDDGYEVLFTHDASVFDGRYANSGWMQEMPDPMTKVTWDNTANLSPASAEELGVKTGDVVEVTVEGKSLSLPVYVMPGHANRSVSIALGYGRTGSGHVGDGVGANAYELRTTKTGYIAHGGRIAATGAKAKLATTQDHFLIDDIGMKGYEQRYSAIVREAQFADYKKKGKDAFYHDHHPPLVSLWKEPDFEGTAWGMSVDLSKCTGCGTCVIACVAENNIPVVGKDEVRRGREMQWLRIDRYFRGEKDNPTTMHQPMHCQQCENAPCEQVCPVGATQHNEEGLNDMAYNRCIGTRYCSNNCPYKVRRFNYFNNQDPVSPLERMVYNPNVTVRSRGVMEKCTWCVQRINRVKIDAKNHKRPIRDGEIVPACAQACPTRAIEFGDLTDAGSKVAKKHESKRAYHLLAELNVQPRNVFLARLKNPHPALTESTNGHHHG